MRSCCVDLHSLLQEVLNELQGGVRLVDLEPVARGQGEAAAARGGVDAVQEGLVVVYTPLLGAVLQETNKDYELN